MKPRLRKTMGGWWWCVGDGAKVLGASPTDAYRRWKSSVNLWNQGFRRSVGTADDLAMHRLAEVHDKLGLDY